MTVRKIVVLCWVVFGVMCLAYLPVGIGILAIHVIPVGPRIALAIVVAVGGWWGPFAYAMYLSMAVMTRGDTRLLKRGIKGTAEVLQAVPTNIWNGRDGRVYKYHLRVSVPGRAPYETSYSVCAAGLDVGSRVPVAVSPHNKKRVFIDHSDGQPAAWKKRVQPTARQKPISSAAADRIGPVVVVDANPADAPGADRSFAEAARINHLERLGRLHSEGMLTDDEFAAEKARILDQ